MIRHACLAPVIALLLACPALADDAPTTQPDAAGPPAVTEREKALVDRLVGSTLEGRFTVADDEDVRVAGTDSYEIRTMVKMSADVWMITGRVRYEGKDVIVPVPMQLSWAGQVAVLTLPRTKLPGLGAYGATLMIDGSHYAGTWTGGDKGGHFFGSIRKPVEDFDRVGLLVSPHAFFNAAADARAADKDFQPAQAEVADRALVTPDGVYAFLETPANVKMLSQVAPGDTVRVQGKLLRSGRLLHATAVERSDAKVDTAKPAADPGRVVTLSGTNKCQCGLKVESLPHNCRLGHLHHLEAADGLIYSYLQFGPGKDLLLGRGSHFKKLTVQARLLGGRYLLVESVSK